MRDLVEVAGFEPARSGFIPMPCLNLGDASVVKRESRSSVIPGREMSRLRALSSHRPGIAEHPAELLISLGRSHIKKAESNMIFIVVLTGLGENVEAWRK